MRYLFLVMSLLLFSLLANGEVYPGCPLQGVKPTPAQLKTILANHRKWVDTNKEKNKDKEFTTKYLNDPLYANLCGANLTGAYLEKAKLTDTVFSIKSGSMPIIVG